jgi:hypothetical protein
MLKRKSKVDKKEPVKVKDSFKSTIIIGDLTELYDEGKSVIGFTDMEYEVHVILQDCIKKINNCKKDHGY